MKDRSDDTSHHERTLLPRSYISLPVNHEMHVENVQYVQEWSERLRSVTQGVTEVVKGVVVTSSSPSTLDPASAPQLV